MEAHFLANDLREITSPATRVSRDFATAYVTPGLRMQFAPQRAIQPVCGGSCSLYEQSKLTLAGNADSAPRFTHGKTIVFGGGADATLWRLIGLRAEMRDFYSGNPAFNLNR